MAKPSPTTQYRNPASDRKSSHPIHPSIHTNPQPAHSFPNPLTPSLTRPPPRITYIARGTHANYGTPGTHDHTIPGLNLPAGPLEDFTSQGPLWDPTLNTYTFSFNPASSTLTPYDPATPSSWIRFSGQWGDQQLPDDAKGQYVIFGQAKFVGGPTGPAAKDLGRSNVCPGSVSPCVVRPVLTVR